MKIKDLIKTTDFAYVKSKISLHYGDAEIFKFEMLYLELKNLQSSIKVESDMYIYITAYKEGEMQDIPVKEFDENDNTLCYDVSAYSSSDTCVYSISASSYSDFLEYNIDKSTLSAYSCETILAHCLWEITAYSFEDNI